MSSLCGLISVLALLAGVPDIRPNVLVVLSDDHSAPHVGCYGNKDVRTPNLDRFAASGLRFDRAYVACPQCVPSRAALMTGRSPISIGMTRFTASLPADVGTYDAEKELRAALIERMILERDFVPPPNSAPRRAR